MNVHNQIELIKFQGALQIRDRFVPLAAPPLDEAQQFQRQRVVRQLFPRACQFHHGPIVIAIRAVEMFTQG